MLPGRKKRTAEDTVGEDKKNISIRAKLQHCKASAAFTYFSWCQMIPIMHLTTVVLAIADVEWDLRKKIGHGEEISEDPVVVCQSLYMKRTTALLPGFLDSIHRDFNWWDKDQIVK